MKIDLEFVERHRVPWLALTFLMVSAACAIFAGIEWRELRADGRHIRDQVESLEQTLKSRKRDAQLKQATQYQIGMQRLKDEQAISASLRYPWNRVFLPIERTDRHGVAILSLSHDQASGITQLLVEALDTKALIEFVDSLNEGNEAGGGNDWYLANYQIQSQNNPATVKGKIQYLTDSHL